MGVHYDHGTGRASDDLLLGVIRQRIFQRLLRQAVPAMRAGDHAQGAVLFREIVQHPDRVADPRAVFVGQSAHVAVQRLRLFSVGIDRTRVHAAQLDAPLQHMFDQWHDGGMQDDFAEDSRLVSQIGQSPGALFYLELGARRLAFGGEQPLDLIAEPGQ